MAAEAVRDGDSYVLNGCKIWISNGGIADFYTVFVRTNEAASVKGISCFVVDPNTPGFTIAERIELFAPLARLTSNVCRIRK